MNKLKSLLLCIAIPLIIGGLAGFISKDSMGIFATLNKPPLSPPGWLFPVAWTFLYVLMGLSSFFVLTAEAPKEEKSNALAVYGLQLFFNFFWSFWFFNQQLYWFSFIWLVVLWILILKTILLFYPISKPAAFLLIPYLIWVTFAGYLNLGIAMLN